MGSHQTSGAGGGGGGTSRRGPEAMAKRYPRGGSFEWGGYYSDLFGIIAISKSI